jgi:hypothetical protein
MRRLFKEEERAVPRRSVATDSHEGESLEEETVAYREEPARAVRKAPARSGRALRWLILIFGSFGVLSAVVPMVAGMSLPELLQGANLKAAYSGSNITRLRGMTAIKAGNLAAATDAVLALPPLSAEAAELAGTLSPKLLEAGDYSRAARICAYLDGSPLAQGFAPSTLGAHLAEHRGLAASVAFLTQNPDALKIRSKILPGIVATAVKKELPALEKFASTLTGEEQASAAMNLVQAHESAGRFEAAWRWSSLISAKERSWQRYILLSRRLGAHTEDVIKHIGSMEPGRDKTVLQDSLMQTLASKDTELSRKYAQQLPPGHQRDLILGQLPLSQAVGWERLVVASKIKSAPERFEALVGLIASGTGGEMALDLMTPIAKNDPALAKTHDDLVRYLCVKQRSTALAEKTLDPVAREALKKELIAGGLHEATFRWPGGSVTSRQ